MTENMIMFNDFMVPKSVAEGLQNGDIPPIRPWQELPTWMEKVRSFLTFTDAKSGYVLGADISKWQGTWNIQKSIDAGLKYAFIKASQNRFTDSKFDEYANQAAVANFPIGCYHFADPAGYSAIQQAQYFANLVKGVGQLSVVLDMEWTGGLSISALSRWGDDFTSEVRVQLGDRLQEIYTRMSWWNSNVALSTWVKDKNIGLWAARWADWLDGPWSDGKYMPRPAEWTDWTNWQWSADGNGLGSFYGVQSGSIDLNYFHGNWEAFVAHYMPAPPDPPTPPVDPDIIKRVKTLETQMESAFDQLAKHSLNFIDHEKRISANESDIAKLKEDVSSIQDDCCGDDPVSQTLNVYAKENVVVFETIYYDKACEEYKKTHLEYTGPDGKPVAEPPKEGRVVFDAGSTFKINANAYVSCKDNPYDYIVHGSGFDFGVVADGFPGAGNYVRLDKIDIL